MWRAVLWWRWFGVCLFSTNPALCNRQAGVGRESDSRCVSSLVTKYIALQLITPITKIMSSRIGIIASDARFPTDHLRMVVLTRAC